MLKEGLSRQEPFGSFMNVNLCGRSDVEGGGGGGGGGGGKETMDANFVLSGKPINIIVLPKLVGVKPVGVLQPKSVTFF